MILFIQQIKKIVYVQTILPTVASISNKSGAIRVQQINIKQIVDLSQIVVLIVENMSPMHIVEW